MGREQHGAGAGEERIAEVMQLHYAGGLSLRAVARKLGLSRNTVRSILGRGPVRRASAPAKRDSILDPYLPAIRELLDETPEMRATVVLERLRPIGYTGGITIVRDRLRRLRPRRDPEAFLTLDFAPASALQVDWADWRTSEKRASSSAPVSPSQRPRLRNASAADFRVSSPVTTARTSTVSCSSTFTRAGCVRSRRSARMASSSALADSPCRALQLQPVCTSGLLRACPFTHSVGQTYRAKVSVR